jgi:dUTPase
MAKIRYTPITNSITNSVATVASFSTFNIIKSSLNILYLWLISFFYTKKIFVKEGTRLFQICAPGLEGIKLKIVDSLDETERGDRGFGSTGI